VTTELLRRALVGDPGLVYFVCGPTPMGDAVQRSLRELGVPLHRVHHELFEMA
jgi:predicted ferric reductase